MKIIVLLSVVFDVVISFMTTSKTTLDSTVIFDFLIMHCMHTIHVLTANNPLTVLQKRS